MNTTSCTKHDFNHTKLSLVTNKAASMWEEIYLRENVNVFEANNEIYDILLSRHKKS